MRTEPATGMLPVEGRRRLTGGRLPVALVLLVGLAHGLLYVFLVPPWQHYDEPTHFEYALWIADKGTLPKPGDYDADIRWQIAASAWTHDFYTYRNLPRPNLLARDAVPWIGFEELSHPPFYYLLVSAPLRALRSADVDLQFYAARLVSLALYLLSIVVAYGLVAELVPAGHPLRLAIPGTLALLPGYADLMTAVNNDVAAVTLFGLFLWGSLRLIRRGFSPWRVLWVAGSAALCAWTKNTVLLAVLLVPIPILFALLRGSWRWAAWALVLGGGLIASGSTFAWGDAALWYRQSPQDAPTRAHRPEAPLGDDVFQLEIAPGSPAPEVRQVIPQEGLELLRGRKVTLGAWIWATEPRPVHTPVLYHYNWLVAGRLIEVGQAPVFVAITATIPSGVRTVQVGLAPVGDVGDHRVTVFYDGLVLAEGERPLTEAPTFDDAEGRQGTWGGRPFVNLLRNASAESSWPWIRPWAETLLARSGVRATIQPSLALAALLDWRAFEDYHSATAGRLLRTFWAEFGWADVSLPDPWYPALTAVTLAGVAGAALALWRGRRRLPWDVALLLGLALLAAWGAAWLRGVGEALSANPYIPVARYTYPAIIPTVLLLCVGWREFLRHAGRLYLVIQLLALLALDAVSLLTITQHYAGR